MAASACVQGTLLPSQVQIDPDLEWLEALYSRFPALMTARPIPRAELRVIDNRLVLLLFRYEDSWNKAGAISHFLRLVRHIRNARPLEQLQQVYDNLPEPSWWWG